MKIYDSATEFQEYIVPPSQNSASVLPSPFGEAGFNLKRSVFDFLNTLSTETEGKQPVWLFGELPPLEWNSQEIVPLLNDALRFAWKRCLAGEYSTLHVHCTVRQASLILEIDELSDPAKTGNCLVSVALGKVLERSKSD
ncbi:MAG: hypothetical protein IH600_02945 [Bacteroidetes bacterium]|nr:hypothetical protein [Bacteroidota bacterium]